MSLVHPVPAYRVPSTNPFFRKPSKTLTKLFAEPEGPEPQGPIPRDLLEAPLDDSKRALEVLRLLLQSVGRKLESSNALIEDKRTPNDTNISVRLSFSTYVH